MANSRFAALVPTCVASLVRLLLLMDNDFFSLVSLEVITPEEESVRLAWAGAANFSCVWVCEDKTCPACPIRFCDFASSAGTTVEETTSAPSLAGTTAEETTAVPSSAGDDSRVARSAGLVTFSGNAAGFISGAEAASVPTGAEFGEIRPA